MRDKPLTEAEMQEELDYITFSNAKLLNLGAAAIIGHFGAGATSRMELRYQAERLMERMTNVPDESVGQLSKEEYRAMPGDYSDVGQYCPGCGSRMCWCGQSRSLSHSEYKGDHR